MNRQFTALLAKLLFSDKHLYDLAFLYMIKPRNPRSDWYFKVLEFAIKKRGGKIPSEFPQPSTSNLSMHTKETERICVNTLGIPSLNVRIRATLYELLILAGIFLRKLFLIFAISFLVFLPFNMMFDFSALTKGWFIFVAFSGLMYGLLHTLTSITLTELANNKDKDYLFHLFMTTPVISKSLILKSQLAYAIYNQEESTAYKVKIQKLITGLFIMEQYRFLGLDPSKYQILIRDIISTQGCEPFWLYFLFRYLIISGNPERIVSEFSTIKNEPKFNIYYLQLVYAMASYICDWEKIPIPIYGNICGQSDTTP